MYHLLYFKGTVHHMLLRIIMKRTSMEFNAREEQLLFSIKKGTHKAPKETLYLRMIILYEIVWHLLIKIHPT
jgi:hypothetical protein